MSKAYKSYHVNFLYGNSCNHVNFLYGNSCKDIKSF